MVATNAAENKIVCNVDTPKITEFYKQLNIFKIIYIYFSSRLDAKIIFMLDFL